MFFQRGDSQNEYLIGMTILMLTLFFVNWLLFSMRLVTTVHSGQLKIQFFPLTFLSKKIDFSRIQNVEVSGWKLFGIGYHLNFKGFEQYNFGSGTGIVVQLNNKRKIYISSKKPDQLFKVVKDQIKK